jgi:serine/threonine-protein kinase
VSTSETSPGSSAEPSVLVGRLFGDRYRVHRLVSEGSNTAIYDSVDEESGRTVTLKLVRPSLSSSPAFRSRFDETMRSVAALSHPNIAALYDWGIARVGDVSTAFVVIEQLTGGSLRHMFDRGRRLSPSQALAVGLDACRGLDYAHRRGFVHSELTPSKLVFGDDRRLRIIDFGLARLLGASVWEQPDAVPTHTAWFASPEQGLSRPIDGKTDVYALCLSLHLAVTGVLPFRDDSTVASLAARVGRLMPVSADLGPLASVFEHAGRPEPDERASAAEFGKELVQVASKLPRPEPLPLLSTGLFETPDDLLRSPDDPTGGVSRPGSGAAFQVVTSDKSGVVSARPDHDVVDETEDTDLAEESEVPAAGIPDELAGPSVPDPPVIVEAEPETDIPVADPAGDLVILPLDAGILADAPRVARPRAGERGVDELAAITGRHQSLDLTDEHADHSFQPTVAPTAVMPVLVAGEAPRRRRGFPWKVLLALMVLAALAGLGVLATQLFRTPVYRVPDLVAMPEAEALNLIATNGWEVTRANERSDEVPVVGQVVRTAPQAGVDLAEGEPFLIVVSDGPTLRELPESAGTALSAAQTRLLERGLDVRVVERNDELVPEGIVISWSVPGDPTLAAGAEVAPGTVVELVASLGPAPRAAPTLVGISATDARAELVGLGLVYVEGAQEFSDTVPLGVVISQSIEPGREVERGSEISVVVSLGPDLVSFPDISVAGNYEAAAKILSEAGFTPRLTFGDAQGQVQSYLIDGTKPENGETFRRGSVVEIRAFDNK